MDALSEEIREAICVVGNRDYCEEDAIPAYRRWQRFLSQAGSIIT
jgi:hypothetical protein